MDAIPHLLQPLILLLIGGLICWVLGRRWVLASQIVALVAVGWSLILSFGNWQWGSAAWTASQPWLRLGAVELTISLRVTSLSGFLALAASGFAGLVVLYSFGYGGAIGNQGKYYGYLLWSLASAIGAFYANNLFFLLVCWELLTLLLYLLIDLGREEAAPVGAAKTFAILGFSDCCMLLAMALVLLTQGTLQMEILRLETTSPSSCAIYLLFLAASLAKAGAIPLHSWIPIAAEGAPISVMALLPAALDKLLGIYLLARLSLNLFALDFRLQALLMVIGAVTVLAAVFMAMVQHDLRRLLSFHAVSQVGYMVLGIGTGTAIGIVGGLFHMLNHAIYKSCLFLCAGSVEERTGEWELDRLGGLARTMPVAFVSCAIAALAISGVPPFNGFASKWLVYQGVLAQGSKLALFALAAAVFGSALTLASFVKVVHSCYWGPRPEGLEVRPARHPWATGIPLGVLALLCLGLGVGAKYPVAYLAGIGATELGQGPGAGSLDYSTGLWSPATATLLILIGIVLGLIVYGIGAAIKTRTTHNFIAGEILPGEAVRYPGTSFYETIRQLPGLSVLYRDGESGAYDVYHLGGHYGGTLVQLLRRAHTGVLLVYVSWCVIGLALILGFLFKG